MRNNYISVPSNETQEQANETSSSFESFSAYKDVLTVDEVQNVLRIGRTTAYRLIRNGDIKSIRIGHNYKIPKRYLLDYLFPICYDEQTARGLTVLEEAIV